MKNVLSYQPEQRDPRYPFHYVLFLVLMAGVVGLIVYVQLFFK